MTEDYCQVGVQHQLSVPSADKNLSSVLCHLSSESGISLIELIMFIVIVSVALAGVLLVMNQTTGRSADMLLRKQAQAAAESLLEEIEAQPFVAGVPSCTPGTLPRTNFINVCSYDGYTHSGVQYMDGTAVSGLNQYNVVVTVVSSILGNIPQASAVQITVGVTDPVGKVISAVGYRTGY